MDANEEFDRLVASEHARGHLDEYLGYMRDWADAREERGEPVTTYDFIVEYLNNDPLTMVRKNLMIIAGAALMRLLEQERNG